MKEKEIYRIRFAKRDKENLLWQILVREYFQRFIYSQDTVLDMACGYGEFINHINCGKKFALDINPEMAKFLKPDIKFLNSMSSVINLPDKSIAKIFASNFFEHLERKQIISTIAELKRVLKEGGEVLVLQPNIRFLTRDYWMFFDHLTPIDDRALDEIFRVYGFEVKMKILRFLPFTTKSRFPQNSFLISLYLKLPMLWRLLGRQSFIIYRKCEAA